MNCFNYFYTYDTAGRPVYKKRCYCKTTGCMDCLVNLEEDLEILYAISKINYGKVLEPINLSK